MKQMNTTTEKWGFLCKHSSKMTGKCVNKNGLDEYLSVIYPNTTDWVYDKQFELIDDEINYKCRPNYRSESLKIVINIISPLHYKRPNLILQDEIDDSVYKKNGYKVIRIPYFIQLTNDVVEKLFGVVVDEPLFNNQRPTLGDRRKRNSPAYLCPEGLKRMARDFHNFPEQYAVNLKALKEISNPILSGVELLEENYNSIS